MPQHGTSVNQALSEGRWVREPVPPCGMPHLDGETPPVASKWPLGAGARVRSYLLKKGRRIHPGLLPWHN